MTTSKRDRSDRIRQLLEPRSIAIIGASAGTGVGATIHRNLSDYSYKGNVYLVNPRYEDIAGERCYPTVDAVGAPVDLAVIAVPAAHVPEAIAACVRSNVGAALIMSAGFAEDVRGGGAALQQAMDAALSGSDMVVCGPNSQGMLNITAGIPVSFSGSAQLDMINRAAVWLPDDERGKIPAAVAGGIAIVAQSGGLGFSLFARGIARGMGFSHVVSVGNETDLDVLECAEYLITCPEVRVIGMYVEGFRFPERLAEVADSAARAGKALVIGKSGTTGAGGRATLSHTGHLAGDAQLLDAAFRRHGVVAVHDQDELLDACWALSTMEPMLGDNVGVVSVSGGTAVWTADALERAGLHLPGFDDERTAAMAALLPSFASVSNPIDITATASTGLAAIVREVAGASYLDAMVLITTLQAPAVLQRDIEDLRALRSETSKPIVFYSYTDPAPESLRLLRELNIPFYPTSTRAAEALRVLREVGRARASWPSQPRMPVVTGGGERIVLTEQQTTILLRDAGLPVLRQVLARSASEAVAAAADIDAPVALKLQAPSVPHKAAIGGVALNLVGAREVRVAFERMVQEVASKVTDFEGILVQEMAQPGLELLVGIDNTAGYGPAIMLGFGGSNVEKLRDTVIELAPLSEGDARAMIGRLRNASVLTQGLGTGRTYAIEALAALLVTVSRWAMENQRTLAELDINPVLITESGVTIVDSLLVQHQDQLS